MTIVKLLGNGQLTLPAEIVKTLKLTDGALLQVQLRNGTVTLRPLDRKAAKQRIRELLEKSWKASAKIPDDEWDQIVVEAVAAAKREELKKLKKRSR
jgi:bifunctional DNA-binding transcriptional regulator/antitoxin component of YhaV-PrlF toxin-antitoxin module